MNWKQALKVQGEVRKGFTIEQRVYLNHDDGLLPATVMGITTHGGTVQIGVDGWVGYFWFESCFVLTEAERQAMIDEAEIVIERG